MLVQNAVDRATWTSHFHPLNLLLAPQKLDEELGTTLLLI